MDPQNEDVSDFNVIQELTAKFKRHLEHKLDRQSMKEQSFKYEIENFKGQKEQFEKDKKEWDNEQKMVKEKSVSTMDEIISLNVGGVTKGFMVRKSLLTSIPGSALEAMFSGRHALHKLDGKVFVDRNPDVFMRIIDYLRNNMRLPESLSAVELEMVKLEMDFWGINQYEKMNKTA